MKTIEFDAGYIGAAAGDKFKRDAAGSAKEIKNFFVGEFIPVIQNIEKVFTGKISGWSRLEVLAWPKNPAFKVSAYYSHL